LATDSTAPLSPSSVLRALYPIGFPSGKGPINVYYTGVSGLRELYVGYWFKPSNPWQGDTSTFNKMHFFMSQNAGSSGGWNQVIDMHGDVNGPFDFSVYFPNTSASNGHLGTVHCDPVGSCQIWPNVNHVQAKLGQWQRIEHYMKMSTSLTSRDGIIRWWVDGVLVGNYTNVNYPQNPLGEFQFAPTFGGNGGPPKNEVDYFYYDHVHLSSSSGGGPKSDLTPPAVPVGLKLN
jgi:hypothetical protein